MASEVDLCNLALSHLGDTATVASVDPPEGSSQAEHCARFYPLARDTLLESHTWGFATRRAALGLLSTEHPAWDYCYAVPNDTMNVLAVIPKDAIDDYSQGAQTAVRYVPQPYVLETLADGTPIVLSDLQDAWARYTVRVSDTGRFSALFTDCLAWLLASYLAGPVIKGDTGASAGKTAYAVYLKRLSEAKASDANDRSVKPQHSVPWFAVR